MTREEIEKVARYLGELVTPEKRHSETVRVIIQQVNAALEEAAKIAERGADEGPVYCEKPECIVASIRALKVTAGG